MQQTNDYDAVILPIISQSAPLLGELRPKKLIIFKMRF